MVRLKETLLLGRKSMERFQFHYGTIKSYRLWISGYKPKLFQFHYGTIKRFATQFGLSCISHFNSTMVRLKELEIWMLTVYLIFQFHYGTIKS